MNEDVLLIKNNVPVVELLAGLAEESAELAQAALKLRRVYSQVNPTPTDEESAYDHLLEEIADVDVYLNVLSVNIKAVADISLVKTKRWVERIQASASKAEGGNNE